jgi:hypothetical protein
MFILASVELELDSYRFQDDLSCNKALDLVPPEGLGKLRLARSNLVQLIYDKFQEGQKFTDGQYQSVYVHGMRATGKTELSKLLAAKLKQEGFQVYLFNSAAELQRFPRLINMLPEDCLTAVLIDEVQSDPRSAALIGLLKIPRANIFVVGFGVPRYLNTQTTAAMFREKVSSDIFIQKDSEEMKDIISYWKKTVNQDAAVQEICDYLCDYCGGHLYPILKFSEYAFNSNEAKGFINSLTEFTDHFLNEGFKKSEFYHKVTKRCFDDDFDHQAQKMLELVSTGKGSASDVDALLRLGWYSNATCDIQSTFLANVLLERKRINMMKTQNNGNLDIEAPIINLDQNNSPQENLELLIVKGLENMEPSDFECASRISDNWVKAEDGMSMSWALAVKKSVGNVFLQFQCRAAQGRVDLYCNGAIKGVIENLCNASQTKKVDSKHGSQDIDEHYSRFTSKKYQWSHWAMLNFAITEEKVLPRDETHHSRVYTYLHKTNTLYQGNVAIKSPAVKSLPSVEQVKYSLFKYIPSMDRKNTSTDLNNMKRNYSTASRLWLSRTFVRLLR